MKVRLEDGPWYCAECGRKRLARRCGCQGTAADAGLLARAQALRSAAEKHPASAPANLADAVRLELLAADAAGAL